MRTKRVKNTLRSIGAGTYQALDLARRKADLFEIAEADAQVSLKDIHNWLATRS